MQLRLEGEARAAGQRMQAAALVHVLARLVEVVAAGRLAGVVGGLREPAHTGADPIDGARGQPVRHHQRRTARAADRDVARRHLARMGHRARHQMRVIGGRRVARAGRADAVPRVLHERRVDGSRLDQRQRDRLTRRLDLAAKRLGKPFDRELGRAIRALERNCELPKHAADVDDRPAPFPQMPRRRERAVHDAPVDDVEHAALVVERNLVEPAVHEGTCVVHPGVEAAEHVYRARRRRIDLLGVRDIGHRVIRPRPLRPHLVAQLAQGVLVARHQQQRRPAFRQQARRREADAGRGPVSTTVCCASDFSVIRGMRRPRRLRRTNTGTARRLHRTRGRLVNTTTGLLFAPA